MAECVTAVQVRGSHRERSPMCEKCVRVYPQHLHFILIKLIYSLLFSAPVSHNLKHSLLSGLGLSAFSCSVHWPAVNLTTGWRRVDFCQRAVICGVSGRIADIACEVLRLFHGITHDTAHHLYLALSDIMQLPWLSEISIMNHVHFHM